MQTDAGMNFNLWAIVEDYNPIYIYPQTVTHALSTQCLFQRCGAMFEKRLQEERLPQPGDYSPTFL